MFEYGGFQITHNDAPLSTGPSWTSDQLVAETLPDNTQHSQHTNIHAPGGIRTHNPSRRTAADLRLRPRGHWDRQNSFKINFSVVSLFNISKRQQPVVTCF